MQISNPFPELTARNTYRATLYSIIVGALLFLLIRKSEHPLVDNALNNSADQLTFGPNWLMVLITSLLLTALIAGVIIIFIYSFFISHKPKLKKARSRFHAFYFTFVLWLAAFLSVQVFIRITAIFFRITLDNLMALAISILLTFIINLIALALMHHYLQEQLRSFALWLKKLILPQKGKKAVHKLIAWGIIAFIGFVPIILLGSWVNQSLLGLTGQTFPPQQIIEFSLANQDPLIAVILFILVTLVAPFFEEIIMRGLVFRGFLKIASPFAAMIFSSVIFAIFHFNIFAFLPVVLIGVLFAWLYRRTGSLIPSIIAHSLFNGITFILLEISKVG